MPAENQVLEQLEALGRRVESTGAGETPQPLRRVLARRRFRRRVNASVIGASCVLVLAAAGYSILRSETGPRDLVVPGPIAAGASENEGTAADRAAAAPLAAATAGAMRQHWAATGDLSTGPSSLAPAREPMRAGEHRGPDAVAEWFSGR